MVAAIKLELVAAFVGIRTHSPTAYIATTADGMRDMPEKKEGGI
jgi:hypothetical protein